MVLGSTLRKTEPAQISVGEAHIWQGSSMAEERELRAFSVQGYLFLGEFYPDSGRKDAALRNLKKAEAMYREMGVWAPRATDWPAPRRP